MKQKDLIKLRKQTDKQWLFAKKNKRIIFEYLLAGRLHNESNPDDLFEIMVRCLSLVVNTLYVDAEYRQKYPPKNYSEEDFINMLIDTIAQKPSSENSIREMLDYTEEYRSILWGYAHYHGKDYMELYTNFKDHCQDDLACTRMRESMVIVATECLLRELDNKIKSLV